MRARTAGAAFVAAVVILFGPAAIGAFGVGDGSPPIPAWTPGPTTLTPESPSPSPVVAR